VSPARRAGSGHRFTKLGFAFFRLVSINDLEPGEPPFAVRRVGVVRSKMAAFITAGAGSGLR